VFKVEKAGPGRPKGSLNRNTLLMKQLGEEFGEQWIGEMKKIALDPDHDHQLRALEILGKKMFPDLKAIEHSGEVDTQPEREIDLTKLEATELDVLKKVLEQKRSESE